MLSAEMADRTYKQHMYWYLSTCCVVVVQEVYNCLAVLSEVFIKRTFETQLQLLLTKLLLVAVQEAHDVCIGNSTYTVVVQERYVIYCTVGLIRVVIYSSSSTQSRRTCYDISLNSTDGQTIQ